MASPQSSSGVDAPNISPEPTPAEALTTSFVLSMGICRPQGRQGNSNDSHAQHYNPIMFSSSTPAFGSKYHGQWRVNRGGI